MSEKMDGFDQKQGIINTLKTALKNDDFIIAVVDMLCGDKNAANRVRTLFLQASQENTLNEMVAVHRLYRSGLNEEIVGKAISGAKEYIGKLKKFRGQSSKVLRKALVATLKKPGMIASFVYIIKAIATVGYPLDDILASPMAIRFIAVFTKNVIQYATDANSLAESRCDGSFPWGF